MSDLLLRLANGRVTGKLTRAAGLPSPLVLAREEGPYAEAPLAGKRVVASASLAEPLRALGAGALDAAGPIDVAALDATAMRGPDDLRELYAFFHPIAKRLAPHARVLVVAAQPGEEPLQAAAAHGAEGFVRSFAKELGRRGATANLVLLADDARDRLVAPMRFLLTGRSAYVSGQVLRIDASVPPAPATRPLLAGKRALVTGAARGLGEATARRLAQEGARVTLADVAAPEALARELGAEALALDVTAPDAAASLGTYDAVVHNAGVTRDRTLGNMSDAEWDAVLGVNLRAIARLDETLLPRMPAGGRVIYLSSVNGIAGAAGQTNYATTKAALLGYVRALAPTLAPRGVTANAVAPGFIDTAMTAKMPTMMREIGRRMNSLSQAGEPRDVAEAVTFLACPDANGVTGQVLRVCGQSLVGA